MVRLPRPSFSLLSVSCRLCLLECRLQKNSPLPFSLPIWGVLSRLACLFLFSCAFSRASSVVTSGPFYFNCNFHCRLQLEAFLVGRFLQDHHHRFQHCFTFCRSFTSLVIIITLHYTLSALYQIYCCYCIFRCFLFTLCTLHFWCSADFTFHEIVCVVQQHLNQSEFSLSFSLEEHITFALHLRNCFVFRLCPFSTLGLSLSTDFSRLCICALNTTKCSTGTENVRPIVLKCFMSSRHTCSSVVLWTDFPVVVAVEWSPLLQWTNTFCSI